MPNTDEVTNFLIWAKKTFPAICSAFFAVVIALLRIAYEDLKTGKTTTTRQKVIESLLCGCITVAIVSGASLIGIPESASSFVAGCIGFLGVDKVRSLAENWVGKRMSITKDRVE